MRNLGNSGVRRSPVAAQIAVLILCSLILMGVGHLVRAPLSALLTPVFGRSAGISDELARFLGGIGQRSESTESLIAQIHDLETRVSASEALVLDRNQLYEENLALKEQFGRSAEPNRVLATILARPNAIPYDTLFIDVGSAHGILVGDMVSAGGSLMVGKVTDVFARTSRVRLYSSPGEVYDGFLRGTIPIEVVGQGAGSLTAEVPYDAKVVEGDTITLPMLEANTAFIVEHVEMGQGNSSVKVFLRLPVSVFNLRFIEVWRQAH